LNQEDINNPNRYIMNNELEAVVVSQDLRDSLLNSTRPLKKAKPMLFKLLHKIER
jgi:hypothetical protein